MFQVAAYRQGGGAVQHRPCRSGDLARVAGLRPGRVTLDTAATAVRIVWNTKGWLLLAG
jgi:hypothetical protein